MMTLTQAISRVCSRLNKSSSDLSVAARIKNHINDACMEKYLGYQWSFRWREYALVLAPMVTTGTLTATNGSNTVTASGTPFNSAIHVGAWLRFTADSPEAIYRVTSVTSTSAVLIDPAYQGTTGASKAYQLMKTDYLLPSELVDIGQLKLTYGQRPVPIRHQLMSDKYYQPPVSQGTPVEASVFNHEQRLMTYSTGTVSGSSGSVTLTGAGTSWLGNVFPGDEITINGDTNVYKVYNVDSDTQITLYEKLTAAVAALTTYTASRQFGHILRVTPCPDNPYVCLIKGLRDYAPLINNADTCELLARYPHAVIESAVWREAGSSPDPREDSLYMRSEMMWAKAQGEDEALIPASNRNPIFNPRG